MTEANIAFKLNGGIFDSILLEDVNPENVVSSTEKQFPMSSFLSVIIAGEYIHPFPFLFSDPSPSRPRTFHPRCRRLHGRKREGEVVRLRGVAGLGLQELLFVGMRTRVHPFPSHLDAHLHCCICHVHHARLCIHLASCPNLSSVLPFSHLRVCYSRTRILCLYYYSHPLHILWHIVLSADASLLHRSGSLIRDLTPSCS